MIPFRELCTDYRFFSVICEPATLDLPPRIRFGNPSLKSSAIWQRHGTVGPRSNKWNANDPISELELAVLVHKRQCFDPNLKNGREGDDVVVPEDGFDFGEVGFGEVRAGVYGAVVYATDF